jgi:hypothetical protein
VLDFNVCANLLTVLLSRFSARVDSLWWGMMEALGIAALGFIRDYSGQGGEVRGAVVGCVGCRGPCCLELEDSVRGFIRLQCKPKN